MAANQIPFIIGTGENKGFAFHFNSSTKLYNEILLDEESGNGLSGRATGRSVSIEEIMAKQESVKKVDPKLPEETAKKLVGVVSSFTSAIDSLPKQEKLSELTLATRNQMVIGTTILPTLIDTLKSISESLNISEIEKIQDSLGMKYVESKKSKDEMLRWANENALMEKETAEIQRQINALDPSDSEYQERVHELELQKIGAERDFYSRNPVKPEPISETRFVATERLGSLIDAMSAIVTSVNKVNSLSVPKSPVKMALVERRVSKAYESMLRLVGNLSTALSAKDIDNAMGWKDSGMDEYVMVNKTASDGTEYRDFFTVKKYNSMTDKEEDVKVKNVDYVRPHFEAEEALLRVGEFVTKVTDPIKKISSVDLSKFKGPNKIKREMTRISKSMSSMVNELIKAFSKIDTSSSKEPLDLLIGDQGEEKIIETLNTVNDPDRNYAEHNQSTEKIISGKRASVIDVVNSFIDTCGKITSFEFKPLIKKSVKFKASTPIVGRAFDGVLNSMVKMIPSQKSFDYGDATNSITALTKFTAKFNEDAFGSVMSVKVPVDKLVSKRREMRRGAKSVETILGGMDNILKRVSGKPVDNAQEGDSNKPTEKGSVKETQKALSTIDTGAMDLTEKDMSDAASKINSRVKAVNGILSNISSLKPEMKNSFGVSAAVEMVKGRVNSALGLFKDISNMSSGIGTNEVNEATRLGNNISSAMTSLEPGLSAMSEISRQSRFAREKDIEKSKLAVSALVDTMEYVSEKDIDFTKFGSATTGLSDTITEIIKLGVSAMPMSEDSDWIDALFGKDDGAMTKFIEAIVNVYRTFRIRKFTPDSAAELSATVSSLDGSIDGIRKLLFDAQDLSLAVEGADKIGLSSTSLGEWGPIMLVVGIVTELLDRIEKSKLDEERIETAKKSIDSLRSATKSLIGIMLSASLLSAIVSKAKVGDDAGEKSKKLLNVILEPVHELGNEETYNEIKQSLKSVMILALELLVLTAVAAVVGTVFITHAKEVIAGMALIGVMVWASLKIMDALAKRKNDGSIQEGALAMLMISGSFLMFAMSILLLGLVQDLSMMSMLAFGLMVLFAIGILWLVGRVVDRGGITKGGIPAICLPLLAIAGSFLMFAMSILLLGLVEDIAISSLISFALLVGIAVGVLWLISKMDKASIKGALVLMVVGGAFIVFSFVLTILAHIAEYCDFLQMLGLVGIIAALIGVAALAGLAIIPLLLGSVGLIALGAALAVFSVGLTILFGVGRLLGGNIEDTIVPIIDTLTYIVNSLRAIAIVDILAATGVALLSLAMVASLTLVTVLVLALKEIAPKPEDTQSMQLAMVGIAGALGAITTALGTIGLGAIFHGMLVTWMALFMLVPLSIVALILLGFSRMRIATEFDDKNKPVKWETLDGSSFDRVGEMMVGLVGALKAVTDSLDDIGVGTIFKGMMVSFMALGMLVPLSIVALILLGFSRMRIATEFDDKNKPVKWGTLDGSSFDRVGDTMVDMVNALNRTTDAINEIGLVSMTKATVKALEALVMIGAVAGIMGILAKIGTKRVPVEWNDKNEPIKWEDFDDTKISESVKIAGILVESIDGMAMMIAGYDTKRLKAAKKNAKLMKGIISPISRLLDLVIRLTEGPISYGEVDENGNPIGNGKELKGSLGDYLNTHKSQVTENIDALIGIFNGIAEKVASEKGIGSISNKTLKRANKNIGLVGQITGSISPMIDLINSLTGGQYNVGTEDKPVMVNLGDYISKKKPDVTKNLDDLFDFIMWIGEKADKMNEGPSNKELRRANRRMGKIGDIIESLNAPLDLIMKMADGEFEIKDEQGNLIEKMNLGRYIATKSKDVEGNLDTLIGFIGHIGDRINMDLNGENSPSKRDLKKADKKTGLIGDVLGTMTDTLDIIEKMASGNIQTGIDENGNPITQNLDKFLKESADGIKDNIGLLIDFIVGKDGIQSHLDKITGEKSNTSEKRQNQINTIQMFSDTIGKILDLTMDIGKQIDDPKTKDLFGTDKDKSLNARMLRLMEGYSVPLNDTAIFSRPAQFKTRLKNLTDYDKLMKRIMDVRKVDNFEKSVKATGDMVNSINSINDSKIDKLNTLMRNMVEFGKTMDESIKNVFDQIIELAEELHYIIEANDRKQNPQNYKNQPQQLPGQQRGNQQQQPQQVVQQRLDTSGIEGRIDDLISLVNQIKQNLPQ